MGGGLTKAFGGYILPNCPLELPLTFTRMSHEYNVYTYYTLLCVTTSSVYCIILNVTVGLYSSIVNADVVSMLSKLIRFILIIWVLNMNAF